MADNQSKVHRFEVGDHVAYTTDGHDDLEVGSEGTVKDFANDERTNLEVDFENHDDPLVVTEDELRRLSA